jgi:hypothetical protein
MTQLHEDVGDALMLFWGLWDTPIGRKTVFPSANTGPTEKEARAALSRVLMHVAAGLGGGPSAGVSIAPEARVLEELAQLFISHESVQRRVVFKGHKQGRGDPNRDRDIAALVDKLSKSKGKKRAVSEVAEKAKLGVRTIERIYVKNKANLW